MKYAWNPSPVCSFFLQSSSPPTFFILFPSLSYPPFISSSSPPHLFFHDPSSLYLSPLLSFSVWPHSGSHTSPLSEDCWIREGERTKEHGFLNTHREHTWPSTLNSIGHNRRVTYIGFCSTCTVGSFMTTAQVNTVLHFCLTLSPS